MITQVLQCFVTVLSRCASLLFSLPVADGVSLGSFLTAAAILGVVISVVFSGIRGFVALYNADYDARQREKAQLARDAARNRRKGGS